MYQIAQLGEKRFENPQTANLHRILVDTIAIHELMTEGESTPLEKQQTKSKQVSWLPFPPTPPPPRGICMSVKCIVTN